MTALQNMAHVLLAWVLTAAGCGSLSTLAVVDAGTEPPAASTLMVGHAVVDITPPPGVGLYGHGPESRVAVALALTLECQVTVLVGTSTAPSQQTGKAPPAYLYQNTNRVAVLVPCELPMPSMLLQRQVAAAVNAKVPWIGGNHIFVMATHTHLGPGHIFHTDNLCGPFSSRLAGCDENLTKFIAGRISKAVIEAATSLKPGRLGVRQTMVAGLSRNRNIRGFHANPRADLPAVLRQQIDERAAGIDLSAVDRRLTLIRVDRQDASDPAVFSPLSALVIFGVHPTAISSEYDAYSGDLFGYARRFVRKKLAAAGVKVRVGIANGIAGDVSSVRAYNGETEARRIGETLADHIVALWNKPWSPTELDPNAPVRVAYRELDFGAATVQSPPGPACRTDPLWRQRTCSTAIIGAGFAGGAPDHPTRLRLFTPLIEGSKALGKRLDVCHMDKLPMFGGSIAAGIAFPRHVPIGVIQLGPLGLITVPGEPTTVAGIRMTEAVGGILGTEVKYSAATSLTNGYIQYISTCAEYGVQLYEGASTIYGPRTADFLSEQFAQLAQEAFKGGPPRPGAPALNKTRPISYQSQNQLDLLHWWHGFEEVDVMLAPLYKVEGAQPAIVATLEYYPKDRSWPRLELRFLDGKPVDPYGLYTTIRFVHPRGRPTWKLAWSPPGPLPDLSTVQVFLAGELLGVVNE